MNLSAPATSVASPRTLARPLELVHALTAPGGTGRAQQTMSDALTNPPSQPLVVPRGERVRKRQFGRLSPSSGEEDGTQTTPTNDGLGRAQHGNDPEGLLNFDGNGSPQTTWRPNNPSPTGGRSMNASLRSRQKLGEMASKMGRRTGPRAANGPAVVRFRTTVGRDAPATAW